MEGKCKPKILRPSEININNISFKKPICSGSNLYNIPVKYELNGVNNSNNRNLSDLIIQTPIVYFPFDISCYNRKSYIDISLLNLDNDKDMINFRDLIISINKKVVNHISHKFNGFKNIKNKKKIKNKKQLIHPEFKNSLKKSIDIFPERLRLTFYSNILVFNENKKLITTDSIHSKIYSKLLISPQFIWKNNESFGVTWTILQAKIYQNIILDDYSFIDDDNNNNEAKLKNAKYEKYDKYIKMVKMGIPIDGVKQRLKLDKLEPEILDKLVNNVNIEKFPKTKKNDKTENKSENKKITLEMLLNVKLAPIKISPKKLVNTNNHLNPLISLDEIRLKLKNLNKLKV